MVFLPIIANNLGKIAAAAATTLGIVGYVNRERISRWLSDEEPDAKERKQGHLQDAAGVLETAESLKNLHGQLAPDELDRKHTELLEKLTAMNTKTMSDFRVLINEAQSEVITSMAELEGQLDAQRSETRALGEELREAVADLARRQDAVEQFLHGKDRGEVFAVPGRQRTAAETPRRSIGGMGALLRERAGVGGRPGGPRDTPWTVQEGPEEARPSRSKHTPPLRGRPVALGSARERIPQPCVTPTSPAALAPWQVPSGSEASLAKPSRRTG